MADARQASLDPDIPDFSSGKSYLIKGETANRLKSVIRRNRPQVITGGGIKIVQQTQDGTYLAIDAEELSLTVCINGVSSTRTFYVKRSTAG